MNELIFLRVGSPGNLTREHLALHPFGGRLMSISETLRCRVESPKQGNNWRPRVASTTESQIASVGGNPRGERSTPTASPCSFAGLGG